MASDDISVASSSFRSSSFYCPSAFVPSAPLDHDYHHHQLHLDGASSTSYQWDESARVLPVASPTSRRRWFWCWLTLLTSVSVTLCTVFAVWLVRRPYSPHLAFGGASFSRMLVNPVSNATSADAAAGDAGGSRYPNAAAAAAASSVMSLEIDSSVLINFYNPSSDFEMHYSPTTFTLAYRGVPLARSKLASFTQEKESKRVVHVRFKSAEVPLHGVGTMLQGSLNNTQPLKLALHATVEAKTNIWGKFVTRRYRQVLTCELLLDAGGLELKTSSCHTL